MKETKFTEVDDLSHASLVTLYDNLLTENISLRDDRAKLRQRLNYKDGVVNSLKTEIAKLKEKYENED